VNKYAEGGTTSSASEAPTNKTWAVHKKAQAGPAQAVRKRTVPSQRGRVLRTVNCGSGADDQPSEKAERSIMCRRTGLQ
jgi:hypothetical protein